jgi:hypothetical protein
VASFRMEGHPEPRVVFSDRIDGGMVIGFDDGKTAYYSAALLYTTLPQAQMMPSDSEDSGLPQGE